MSPSSPRTLNNSLLPTLAGAAGIGTLLWLSSEQINRELRLPEDVRTRLRADYGTLCQPKFLVAEPLPHSDGLVPAHITGDYGGMLNVEKCSYFLTKCRTFEKRLATLSTQAAESCAEISNRKMPITTATNEGNKKLVIEFFELRKEILDLVTEHLHLCREGDIHQLAQEIRVMQVSEKVASEQKARTIKSDRTNLSSAEEYLRQIVRTLTGQELSESVTFSIEDIEAPGIVGLADGVTQRIISEDAGFVRVLLTFAHEAGHLMCQQRESFAGGFRTGISKTESAILEEAGAYAFEFCVASYLAHNDTKYGETAKALWYHTYFTHLVEYHLLQKEPSVHASGMAALDAVYGELGSCGEAFNFLSSNKHLTQSMKDILTKKNRWFRTLSDGSLTDHQMKVELALMGLSAELHRMNSAITTITQKGY